jgi:hypothetical protein
MSGFSRENMKRPPVAGDNIPSGLVVANIYYFEAPLTGAFVDFFEHTLKPVATSLGATISAYFVTENSENTFPALPVRHGENVFVWFSMFRDPAGYANYEAALSRSERWCGEVSKGLALHVKKAPEILKLAPTARSQLRG